MRRSRLGWAGLFSVLLHAALLALLWEQEPVRRVSAPPPPQPPPLVVEILPSPPEPPVAPPPTPPPPPPPLTRPDSPPSSPSKPPPARPPEPAPPASPPPAGSEAPSTAPPAEPATPLDAPKVPSLLPADPTKGWSMPEPPEQPRGRTIRPGDPSLSPEALRAEEKARVTERVQTFAENELATLRVENGLIHPYFSQIRASLEKQLENAPLFDTKGNSKRLAQSWLERAERFGATGSTSAKPRDARAPPTALEKLETLPGKGSGTHNRMRAFLQAGEAIQQMAEPAPELVIILELQQAADGQLQSVKVVERSGNKAFDAYVLEAVPPALARLTPPPAGKALGVHPDGIRSLWAVEGRVVYLRKLSELEGEDAWYIASATGLGVLAGRFDETTGEVYVIDLRNPKFVCSPRLLRVW